MSTIPLLLKIQNVSYGSIGFFAISAAPYSLKLLWSPIVDSIFSKSIFQLVLFSVFCPSCFVVVDCSSNGDNYSFLLLQEYF